MIDTLNPLVVDALVDALRCSAYRCWRMSLFASAAGYGSRAAHHTKVLYEWFDRPEPGDLVVELTTAMLIASGQGRPGDDGSSLVGIGRLLWTGVETLRHPDEPEGDGTTYDERCWYVVEHTGRVVRWRNCDFARVPEHLEEPL